MTVLEEILKDRQLVVLLGIENHSIDFNISLFDELWDIPSIPQQTNILIIPIAGLDTPYKISNEKYSWLGYSYQVLFVKSYRFNHFYFLLDTFPQKIDNSYFTKERIRFLQQTHCSNVFVCDIGVYKSDSLMKMLESAILNLSCENITVGLATILGYNSRGATDIELEDETDKYTKDFYLRTDIVSTSINPNFEFIQIDRKFNFIELTQICSFSKNPAKIRLQRFKEIAKPYRDTLKLLWDCKAIETIIRSFSNGSSFDFNKLESSLKDWGFNGSLVDCNWNNQYSSICRNIRNANNTTIKREVDNLINLIGLNIKATLKLLETI
ncbi:MAG: hypothetical protein K1W14_05795 [Muribaculaceae bacterium]